MADAQKESAGFSRQGRQADIMSSSHNLTSSTLFAAQAQEQQQHALFHARPIYHTPAPSLLSFLSDPLLAVLAPVPTYWLVSAFFHLLDCSSAPWLVRRRIHDSAEVAARNRVTRAQVLRAVVVQQVIQTVLAVLWVSEHPESADHASAMRSIVARLLALFPSFGSFDEAAGVLVPLAYLLYWWVIPAAQLLLAMYVKLLSLPRTFFNC